MTTTSESTLPRPRIVIVRDRATAGGGIHAFYNAIAPHLRVGHQFLDVGRPHIYYGKGTALSRLLARSTPLRLLWEWLGLVLKLLRFPDLVHVNPGLDIQTRRSLRRDAVNVWLAKLFRRPVLVFWRGWDNAACGTPEFPGGNGSWLCRTYQRADAHVVLARDFESDLRRWNFTTPIHLETTVVPDDVLAAGRDTRDHSSGTVNLLFLSRIEVAKGVFELLEAYALLSKRSPGFYSLTFAGDGPALAELKERAAAAGMRRVSFPGYVAGRQKIECYRKADVFCFLSYTEGMPNAVLEAMAMRLPIISSGAGGLKDILREAVTGLIVEQRGDASDRQRFLPEAVADAIERLATDPGLYRRISDHNREYAVERFSAPVVARRLENIYAEMLGASASAKLASVPVS